MASSFSRPTRKPIDPGMVARATAVAASSPLVADPRTDSDSDIKAVAQRVRSHEAPVFYAEGQVYEVAIGAIKANPLNPRVYYTSVSVDEMVASLQKEGQQVAATAFVDAEGQLTLIDGEKRLRAARAAGMPTLRVEVRPRPAEDRQLYESARSTNLRRSEQTPLDDAVRWKDMIERRIYPDQQTLAVALSIHEETVSRTMRLAVLPERIVRAMVDVPELLKLRLLNAIREYWESCKDEAATLSLINEVADKGLGYREVEQRRRALSNGPISKPRAIREPLRVGDARGEMKSFPDGRLELMLKGLSEDQQTQIRGALVQALKALD